MVPRCGAVGAVEVETIDGALLGTVAGAWYTAEVSPTVATTWTDGAMWAMSGVLCAPPAAHRSESGRSALYSTPQLVQTFQL
jgi:hypothetical protein